MIPRLTIGLPFRDEEHDLAAAIRSILAQTFTDFELLLVDDGSRDGSLAVARGFRDPRVTVITDGVRRGLPARLNEVARRARGALVARMDADDVSHPRRIEREIALLDGDASCDAVGTWAGLVDHDESLLGIIESAPLPATAAVALERGILVHASMVARRAWHLANPYDEALTRAEDRDLWCRTVATTRFLVVPEPLYVVRVTRRDRRFLTSYVASQRQNRILVRRHGTRVVGAARTARLLAETYAKEIVMRAAFVTGTTAPLVRRRGRAPSVAERALVAEALAAGQRP